jgi:hypothetical protein
MRANHYYFPSVSRQDANNVRWQLRAKGLFGKMLDVTSRLGKPVSDALFPFAIVG